MNENQRSTMTEKFEYDAAIGGNVRLENDVTTFQHCHQYMDEIKALTSVVENPNTTKLVFQKLPKHMRRRAMSHNPNRLPRKYRLAHRSQMTKSGAPIKTKRPSRKYRRKPSNLLLEYQRRQRKHVWLETHIWHAKRFRMTEKWGFKLAESSCDKTFRSSYRATTKHCLIQDISYIDCIEIAGSLDVLRNGFERMRGNGIGLGICAKAYLSGSREGSIELFAIDSYPYQALGCVNFMWKRKEEHEQMHRLWLFVHPSIYTKLVEELCKLFELEEMNEENATIPSQLKPKQYSNSLIRVELYELKQYVNRFRLTGPLSHSVLSAAFKPKTNIVSEECSWFTDYLKDSMNAKQHEIQANYWQCAKDAKSASDLSPNSIIALNIEDPRINRPKKRTKAIPNINEFSKDENLHEFLLTLPINSSDSVIWNRNICERIKNEKVSTHEICVQRNKDILVPGERCAFENKLQPIPVIVIQRFGSKNSKRLGYGSGYDVIVPFGYGISTWMCLIMYGAKPGALRETETICREALEDEFLPDTETARINSDLQEIVLRKK